ncbi:olfactory receptor 5J3-like [Pleurodeles waltl]|uniref:olfactory receptor 5J3-like n=1 Tax=Pleurodeles waltl TaxID=8319 RepID=UPI0037097E4C
MKERNQTSVREFILIGLSEDPKLKLPLFIFFVHVYGITLLGNLCIIILIRISPRLHTPMYFLLSNLSFVALCYSSTITPNMLENILSRTKTISFLGCITQIFFFVGTGSVEVFLLAVMPYDRFVAICNPLVYATIMTNQACMYLVVISYLVAYIHSMIHIICMLRLDFCGSNRITHFYCDVPPLLNLSCSDTSLKVAILNFVTGSLILGSLICIIVFYTYILYTILKISSSETRLTVFYTCSSHFASVTLCFGTLVFMYISPSSKYAMEQDRVASVFYTVIIPMLNPMIYSLRNKDVKEALRKVINRKAW